MKKKYLIAVLGLTFAVISSACSSNHDEMEVGAVDTQQRILTSNTEDNKKEQVEEQYITNVSTERNKQVSTSNPNSTYKSQTLVNEPELNVNNELSVIDVNEANNRIKEDVLRTSGNLQQNIYGEENQVLFCPDFITGKNYFINIGKDNYIYEIDKDKVNLIVSIPAKYLYIVDGLLYFIVDNPDSTVGQVYQDGAILSYDLSTKVIHTIVEKDVEEMYIYDEGIYFYKKGETEVGDLRVYSFESKDVKFNLDYLWKGNRIGNYFISIRHTDVNKDLFEKNKREAIESGHGEVFDGITYESRAIKLTRYDKYEMIERYGMSISDEYRSLGGYIFSRENGKITMFDILDKSYNVLPLEYSLEDDSFEKYVVTESYIYTDSGSRIDRFTKKEVPILLPVDAKIIQLYTDMKDVYALVSLSSNGNSSSGENIQLVKLKLKDSSSVRLEYEFVALEVNNEL